MIANVELYLQRVRHFFLQGSTKIDVCNGSGRLYDRHVKVKSKHMMGGLMISII